MKTIRHQENHVIEAILLQTFYFYNNDNVLVNLSST